MRTTVDVRKYGDSMREQGKTSFEEARKLVHAWVGATDLAYERVRTELKDLDARAQVDKLQKQAKSLTVADVRKQFRVTYTDLAKRGEKVIRDLRRRPQTRLVFTRTEKALKDTEKRVEEAEQHVTGRPAKKPAAHKAQSNSR